MIVADLLAIVMKDVRTIGQHSGLAPVDNFFEFWRHCNVVIPPILGESSRYDNRVILEEAL
jgi:hypothetical protein